MKTFREQLDENLLGEKSLSDADIQNMIQLIQDRIKGRDRHLPKNTLEIKRMNASIRRAPEKEGFKGYSPAQVGWLMKTSKALSGG